MYPIDLPSSRRFAFGGILLALIATHAAAETADNGTALAQSPRTAADSRAPSASTRLGNPVDSGGFARSSGVTPAISNNPTPAFRGDVTPAFRGSVTPAFSSDPTPPVGVETGSRTDGAVPSSSTSGSAPDTGGFSSSGSVDAGAANAAVGSARAARTRDAGSATARAAPAVAPANTDADGNERDIGGIEAVRDDDPDFVIVGNMAPSTSSSPTPQFTMICRSSLQSDCDAPPAFVILDN